MLEAIAQGLQASVAKEVTSEMARTVCDFSTAFLGRVAARYTQWPGILSRQIRRQAEVLRRMTELLASAGVGQSSTTSEAQAIAREVAQRSSESLEQLEQSQRKIDAALERIVPLILRDDKM